MKVFGFNIGREKRKTVVRDYDVGRSSDLYADFRLDGGWVPGTMADQLPTIRAKSRQETKNNPWLRYACELFAVNVVGDTGFAFRSTPTNPDGSIDRQAARIVTAEFWRWMESADYCDIAGQMDFRAFCDLAATEYFRDGEALIRIVRARIDGNPFAFALQALNPAMLDARLNAVGDTAVSGMAKSSTAIVNGVELDRYNRPVAYWFTRRETSQAMYTADYMRGLDDWQRIPASEIIHIFDRQMAEQVRGVPVCASVLNRLHMLGGYEKAELSAARKDANVSSTYESQGANDPDELADVSEVIKAASSSQEGTDLAIPYGWQRKTATPSRPNSAFSEFDRQMLRGIASGLGTDYSTLANDLLGVSYSSMRSAKQVERDVYRRHQAIFIRSMCRRVYLAWLEQWLSLPGNPFPPERLAKLSSHSWRGRRWPWVDPNSESRYNEMCRRYGWKTDATIAEELGEDFADNVTEIKQTAPQAKGTYLESGYAVDQPTTPTD